MTEDDRMIMDWEWKMKRQNAPIYSQKGLKTVQQVGYIGLSTCKNSNMRYVCKSQN